MNFFLYQKFEIASKKEDDYWLAIDKEGLIKPDYKYVLELKKEAREYFFQKFIHNYNYEEYLANQVILASNNKNFVKLKFIIDLLEYKGIKEIEHFINGFTNVFEVFCAKKNQISILPHFYVLERLIDLLQDYPTENFILPLSYLNKLENRSSFSDIKVCILKSFTILVEIGSPQAIKLLKQFSTHFDNDIREEAIEILSDLDY